MKKELKKDSGVSPVIGTILLVAITVVLVAIISAVVMGMAGNIGTYNDIGAIVSHEDKTPNLLVTITSAEDGVIEANSKLLVNVGSAYYEPTFTGVGEVIKVVCASGVLVPNTNEHVSVAVKLADGTTQTVFDGDVRIGKTTA